MFLGGNGIFGVKLYGILKISNFVVKKKMS